MDIKKKTFMSLKLKMSIGVIVICFLIGIPAVILVNRISKDIIEREHIDKAEQITEAMVNALDTYDVKVLTDEVMGIYQSTDVIVPSSEWGSEAWNTYMSNYAGIEEMPVFDKVRKQLRAYQDIFKVDCIYIMKFNTSDRHAIYIIDGAYEDACPPGCVDSFENGFWPDESGRSLSAKVTNEELYGYLVSAGYPIILDGEVIAFLCVDISMNDIRNMERDYVLTTTAVMIAITLLVFTFSLIYVSRNVVGPVALLSDTARNYCSESSDVVHHAFEKLNIDNNDEISQLLSSMKQMEADMNANINALMDTKEALKETEEKASTMKALAVKDTLTGVWNRLAYDEEMHKLDKEIAEGFTEFGIAMIDLNYLKMINDTYGHECGNIALKRLSGLICDVFKRSQVFRIGGDEFVVILKNKDFKKVDKRIERFNTHLMQMQSDDSLKPWEKVSAAIGYAAFDKKRDKNAGDVFKNADKAMYKRKKSMKAGRDDKTVVFN